MQKRVRWIVRVLYIVTAWWGIGASLNWGISVILRVGVIHKPSMRPTHHAVLGLTLPPAGLYLQQCAECGPPWSSSSKRLHHIVKEQPPNFCGCTGGSQSLLATGPDPEASLAQYSNQCQRGEYLLVASVYR